MVQVHAANKPIDRGNDDHVLQRVAELAVGYSGAELANLLNEAAILAVSPLFPVLQLLYATADSPADMPVRDHSQAILHALYMVLGRPSVCCSPCGTCLALEWCCLLGSA